MCPDEEISTPRRRRRRRLRINEALAVTTKKLRPLLNAAPGSRMTLSWRRVAYSVRVTRLDDELRFQGDPGEQEIRVQLAAVPVGLERRALLLRCPQCHGRKRKLYFRFDSPRLKCRQCHRLRYREHDSPDSVERLRTEWQHVGDMISRVEFIRAFGDRAQLTEVEPEVRVLKRQIKAIKKELAALAPPGLLEETNSQ